MAIVQVLFFASVVLLVDHYILWRVVVQLRNDVADLGDRLQELEPNPHDGNDNHDTAERHDG